MTPAQTAGFQAANAAKSGPVTTSAGSYIGDEAVYTPLASSAVDGLVFNPPSQSVSDYLNDLSLQNIL